MKHLRSSQNIAWIFSVILKNGACKIIDFLTEIVLEPNPEKFIGQRYLRNLHFECQDPKNVLFLEVPDNYCRKDLRDKVGIHYEMTLSFAHLEKHVTNVIKGILKLLSSA